MRLISNLPSKMPAASCFLLYLSFFTSARLSMGGSICILGDMSVCPFSSRSQFGRLELGASENLISMTYQYSLWWGQFLQVARGKFDLRILCRIISEMFVLILMEIHHQYQTSEDQFIKVTRFKDKTANLRISFMPSIAHMINWSLLRLKTSSWCYWLIWPLKCLILVILTITRDSTLSSK